MNQVVRVGWREGARLDLPAPSVYWPSPTSFPYILPVSAAQLPHILLVRFSAMGDILLMTPLLRTLWVRHPEAAITVVTKQSHLPLLEHNPRVSHLIGYDPATPLRALASSLQVEGRMNRSTSGRTAIPRSFSFLASGCTERRNFSGPVAWESAGP